MLLLPDNEVPQKPGKSGKDEDALAWAERVTAQDPKDNTVPTAEVHEHRTLHPEDLSYDFLSKMGFVPPPPSPPWGFNKANGSTAEIEERVMRCVLSFTS